MQLWTFCDCHLSKEINFHKSVRIFFRKPRRIKANLFTSRPTPDKMCRHFLLPRKLKLFFAYKPIGKVLFELMNLCNSFHLFSLWTSICFGLNEWLDIKLLICKFRHVYQTGKAASNNQVTNNRSSFCYKIYELSVHIFSWFMSEMFKITSQNFLFTLRYLDVLFATWL